MKSLEQAIADLRRVTSSRPRFGKGSGGKEDEFIFLSTRLFPLEDHSADRQTWHRISWHQGPIARLAGPLVLHTMQPKGVRCRRLTFHSRFLKRSSSVVPTTTSPDDFVVQAVREKLSGESRKGEFYRLSDETRAAMAAKGLTEADLLADFEASRRTSSEPGRA